MKEDKVEHVTGWRHLDHVSTFIVHRFIFYRCGIKWWHLIISTSYSMPPDVRLRRKIRAYRKTGKGLKQTSPQVAKDLMTLLWPEWVTPDGYLEDQFPEENE